MNYFVMKGKIKYVLSCIDGNLYCKTNGSFKRHLIKNGISEEEYFNKFIGPNKICHCGNVCTFSTSDWTYIRTCGNRNCVGLEISKVVNSFSDDRLKEIGSKKSEALKQYYQTVDGIKTKELVKSKILKDGVQESAKLKRMKTCMERYGDQYYSNSKKASLTRKSFDIDKKKKIYKSVYDTKIKRYGPSIKSIEGSLSLKMIRTPEYYKATRKKAENTWLKKYGTPYFPHSKFIGNTSKPQRRLCEVLIASVGGNYQYNGGELRIERFHYDYVLDKKIIEFNGDYWHASPRKYHPTDIVSLPKNKKMKAEDIWAKDKFKHDVAVKNGYDVKIIWEYDFLSNEQKIIEECIKWLQS